MGFGRRDKRVDMDVVGSAGWVVGWIRQDLSSVEHVGDLPQKDMCKGLGAALSVMRTAYRIGWGRMGPVDGSELCIKGKVDGVVGRCKDTVSGRT